MSGQEHFLDLPYHIALVNGEMPLSIGGGIGQSRTNMYILKRRICAKRKIFVLE